MADKKQFVAFMLGDEEYAADILCVQEIIRWSNITRVPKAPLFVKGIINLRGTVIPIADSHIRFNLPEQTVTDASRIIVFKLDDAVIGLTVDTVTEVLSLSVEQIEKPQDAKNTESPFIQGIGKYENRLLIILDANKVLDLGNKQIKE